MWRNTKTTFVHSKSWMTQNAVTQNGNADFILPAAIIGGTIQLVSINYNSTSLMRSKVSAIIIRRNLSWLIITRNFAKMLPAAHNMSTETSSFCIYCWKHLHIHSEYTILFVCNMYLKVEAILASHKRLVGDLLAKKTFTNRPFIGQDCCLYGQVCGGMRKYMYK